MKATLLAVLLSATVLLSTPTYTHAQDCIPSPGMQHDLAGFYASSTMQLSIYPCGGSFLQWDNAYGTHGATYVTQQHLSDGVVAIGYVYTTNGYLDGSPAIAYKAADPGYLQVITHGPLGARIYRLKKMY